MSAGGLIARRLIWLCLAVMVPGLWLAATQAAEDVFFFYVMGNC